MALLPIAGAVLGGLAGAQGNQQSVGMQLAPEGALEAQGRQTVGTNLGQLQNFTNLGPGAAEVSAGLNSSNKLAAMLDQYSKGGFLPNQQDWNTANQFAQTAFQGQQVALNQGFQEQQQRANQLASQLGRPVNDPIIQARLSQEKMQSGERLAADQGAYASQFAMNLPQQRLGYTSQLADVNNALASQAMKNREALLSLGSQVQNSERNFRLQTATRTSSNGGGLGGAISGALAGAGAFANLGNMFSGGNPTNPTAQGGPQYGPQTAAQAGYSAPRQMASTPGFSQSLSTGFNSSIPTSLQPNNAYNTMVSPALQFNSFGMMSPFGTNNQGNFSIPSYGTPQISSQRQGF